MQENSKDMNMDDLGVSVVPAIQDGDFYRNLLNEIYDGVYFVDSERRILYWNKGAHRLSGYRDQEVVGRSCADNVLCHVDETGVNLCGVGCPLALTLADGNPRQMELYLHHKEGHRVPVSVKINAVRDEGSRIIGAVEIFGDNSQYHQVCGRVEELERLALLDTLTGLPNRRYLQSQLEARLQEFGRYGLGFGVLFVDVDRFKDINDGWGHDVGDTVLRMVSRSLAGNARQGDLVGRWGGDEFMVVLPHQEPQGLATAAERYAMLVRESVMFQDDGPLGVTISLGGTCCQADDGLDLMLRRADQALYQAKEQGRDRAVVFRT